ncbi:hypothetical protein CEXT_103711 [Caerostris extrusa]|uniref:Uncharacterized protein n=1 Tax=Caerostris extrusa TaxID=172846 RepID=A0AAV4QAR1_CAEEX|nr:hypothetical protein CEXT_103711 [Caerostris extrusa]
MILTEKNDSLPSHIQQGRRTSEGCRCREGLKKDFNNGVKAIIFANRKRILQTSDSYWLDHLEIVGEITVAFLQRNPDRLINLFRMISVIRGCPYGG